MKHWTVQDMPDMQGRLALVTGANSGIGLETTRALVARGAHVVMACRNLDKAREAQAIIEASLPQASLELLVLDLASLASVRACAAHFCQAHQRLDLLINNAGVMWSRERHTEDSFELRFGTNHLGHFALTGLLLPSLLATPAARVVTVSSLNHAIGRIDVAQLTSDVILPNWEAYNQSKLANLLFAYELQRRFAAAHADVLSVGCHPGSALTHLGDDKPGNDSRLRGILLFIGGRLFPPQSAAMGALPTLYAATAPEIHGGDYIGPAGLFGARGYPAKVRSNARSHDQALGQRLWQISEEMTGVRYAALESPLKG